MSFPNIPPVVARIDIDKEQAINLLLASIAFEELGQSHIINAEAEKIQYAVGTLNGHVLPDPATLDEVLSVNDSATRILRGVIKNQMLLQFKLEDIIAFAGTHIFMNIATVTAHNGSTTVTASDTAYYSVKGGAA